MAIICRFIRILQHDKFDIFYFADNYKYSSVMSFVLITAAQQREHFNSEIKFHRCVMHFSRTTLNNPTLFERLNLFTRASKFAR